MRAKLEIEFEAVEYWNRKIHNGEDTSEKIFVLKVPRQVIKKVVVDNNTIKSLAIEKKRTFDSGTHFCTICNHPYDINTVSNMGKMIYNPRKTVVSDSVCLQIQSQGKASSRDMIVYSDPNSDANSGLTQNFQDLSVKEEFHTTPGTILFIPDTVKKLYKVQVLEKSGHETKIRCSGWGSEHDSWFNAKSIWVYSKHKNNLNNRKKITKKLQIKLTYSSGCVIKTSLMIISLKTLN